MPEPFRPELNPPDQSEAPVVHRRAEAPCVPVPFFRLVLVAVSDGDGDIAPLLILLVPMICSF